MADENHLHRVWFLDALDDGYEEVLAHSMYDAARGFAQRHDDGEEEWRNVAVHDPSIHSDGCCAVFKAKTVENLTTVRYRYSRRFKVPS